jgi:hypothetical protein
VARHKQIRRCVPPVKVFPLNLSVSSVIVPEEFF